MARIVKRAYKYRFYPTSGQASQLARTFGCVRLVYNKALEERTRAYAQEGKRVSYAESSAMLTQWKRSGEGGQCQPDDLNRSAFMTWVDCTL